LGGYDCLRLAERTGQAIAEIRALTGWLLERGCPAVALWGGSYGGWLAGLTACYDARLNSAVMAVPGVRSNRSRSDLVLWPKVRGAMRQREVALETLDQTALNLTTKRPVIPKENILLIEAVHDLLTPPAPIEELWRQWGQPNIWRVPHGHFRLQFDRCPGVDGGASPWLVGTPAGRAYGQKLVKRNLWPVLVVMAALVLYCLRHFPGGQDTIEYRGEHFKMSTRLATRGLLGEGFDEPLA
jgi:hypothetical protein